MTFDLYAGDNASRDAAGSATFNVIADADPDLVLRVSAALNMLNTAPREFHMEARSEGTAEVRARIACAELQAELIARKLWQITSVRDVVVNYAGTRA
jgi:hypothetical protein